jgi:glycosyltransferase involved in cell wall biosynthesis
MHPPRVAVVMSVYNGERYLREAIDSILGQSLKDFEFLIIDDGSDDSSVDIVRTYFDQRIRLIVNKKNIGLAASLNIGIDAAKSRYIARMDCDDISLPKRLETQVAFLERHPDIGICGTGITLTGNPAARMADFPRDDALIRAGLIFNSTLAHPTVMMARQLLQDHGLHYDTTFTRAQDYDLWTRCAIYTKFANIPQILLRYRVRDIGLRGAEGAIQYSLADRVRVKQLQHLGMQPTQAELALHHAVSTWQFRAGNDSLERLEMWFGRLIQANAEVNLYPLQAFHRVLAEKWAYACNVAARQTEGLAAWRHFRRSPLASFCSRSLLRELKLLGKCLVSRDNTTTGQTALAPGSAAVGQTEHLS